MRQERCIGREDDQDRARFADARAGEVEWVITGELARAAADLATDWDARNRELSTDAVVRLHEHAERIATEFGGEFARTCTDAAFVLVTHHAGAPADTAFGHRAGTRATERGEHVLGFNVKSIDVVQPAVPGFRDDRQ